MTNGATLLASEPVERQMKQQWEEAAAGMTDKQREEAIWEKVCKALGWARIGAERDIPIRIYSWVASLLLLLGMAGNGLLGVDAARGGFDVCGQFGNFRACSLFRFRTGRKFRWGREAG